MLHLWPISADHLCLDAHDLGISRVAGSVEAEAGVWWLVNKSAVRPLEVVDDVGIRTVLPPGRRIAVTAPITVVVEGVTRRHALTVDLPEDALEGLGRGQAPTAQVEGNPTQAASDVSITPADKLALVALFSGYLEAFPRYDPHPKSYADAAARLALAPHHAGEEGRVPAHPAHQRGRAQSPRRERSHSPGRVGLGDRPDQPHRPSPAPPTLSDLSVHHRCRNRAGIPARPGAAGGC